MERTSGCGLPPASPGRCIAPYKLALVGKVAPGLILVLVLLLNTACSNPPYRYQPLDQFDITERAETQSSDIFEIKASVPSAAEARDLFGIDVYDRDVQPIWLQITNLDSSQARVVISSIDDKYFPPAEVAYFFRKKFSKQGWMDLEQRLFSVSLPRFIKPGETASGFVFTNLSEGTKSFNLDIFQGTIPPSFEQFTFFLRVPGFLPDYAEARLGEFYAADELIHVDTPGLAAALRAMACCTSNQDGSQRGRPVDLYIVSEPFDLLRALLQAGWSETPSGRDATSAESAFYFLNRPADGVFRKPRNRTSDRSELDLWKTALMVDGKPVWAAQLRHAIGQRFALGERLFGVRLDPDTNEARNYVLQDFWYTQSLDQWASVATGLVQSQAEPAQDFLGNPWFATDGLQMVLWISPEPVAMNEVSYIQLNARKSESGPGS